MATVKTKKARKIKRSEMHFINPATGNVVCYLRAAQLKLLTDKNVKTGILNPKTGRLVTPATALRMKLIN